MNKEFKSVCYEIKVMMDSCEEREIDGAIVSEVPLIRAVPDNKTNSVRVSGLDSGECEIFFSDSNNFATGLKKLKSLGCR